MRTHSSCRVLLLSLILPFLFVSPSLAGVTQDAFERGLQAAEENQFQRAVGELTQAIELNPNDADAYAQRARCNSKLNDYGAAIVDCTKALKINPKHARALEYRSFAELYTNDMQRGEADSKLASLYVRPDGFDILTSGLFKNLGKLSRMRNNVADAEKYFRRARALESLRLAKEARETKQMEKAIALVNKALVDSPNEVSAYLLRGIFEDNMNDYPKAIADLTQAIKLDPKLVPAYYYRADVYSQLGRQKQAVADYTTLISLKPRIVAFRLVTETGRLRDHFTGTDDHIVNLEDIYYLRGKAQTALANKSEALADFEIACKLDPQDNDPIARKAELQSKAGQTGLALKTLSKSVSNDDTDWQTLASRAQVFEVQKDYSRAMRDYSRIIALNPKQPGAYFLRAQLSAKLGDLKAAIKDYTQMLLLEPDSDEAYKSRADCYYRLGQYRSVVADCTAGIKCEADNASLYTLRANAYDKLGQKSLASIDRERANLKADH